MNKIPKLSVIMSVYNSEKYLKESIESVLQQTFSDFEFIIIDDASTDNSLNILKEFQKKDNRIIIIKNKYNLKICDSLNKWLKIAKAELIARMDGDDICFLDRFQKQVSFLEKNKNIWVLWWQIEIIDEKSKKIWEKKYPVKNLKKQIFFRNPFLHSSVIIRRKCFDDFWFYDNEFLYSEDLELWIRFWQKYDFSNLNDFILKYRISSESSTIKNQKSMILSTLNARKKAISLWYKMDFSAKIIYFFTFLAFFFPRNFVLKIFNLFVNKLWK